MNHLAKLVAAVAVAVPLAAVAQMSPNVKPADQPRSQLEQEQTTKNGQAMKYGGPGTDAGAGPTTPDSATTGMKHKGMKHKAGMANTTKPGDAPTYPAPAPDGTPTK
ncbi:MAG: hypothetical protein ABI277_11755 [Burkholderiaceae bacterium]